VLALKKNAKLMVCVDFRNICLRTLKDKYHMLMVDILIDAASDNEIFSFMNGCSSYNQIFIIKEDISRTIFRYSGSLRCMNGLKNTCATCQGENNLIPYENYQS
jgi:hypothetical protein